MIRVCIAGVTGWVGEPLAEAVSLSDDLELVAAVARHAEGKCTHGLRINGALAEALETPCDVVVDFTSAEAVKSNVALALNARRHVVIGSSGLTDADFAEIDALARSLGLGVVAGGNFAISAILLERFAIEAAQHLPSWEIIDYASDAKIDAPSGTARELAWHLAQSANPPSSRVPPEQTVGAPESRGASLHGIRVHSVRLPGHVIGLEVLFGGSDERLSIRYESGASATTYIEGTLRAIRRAPTIVGLQRGLVF